MKKAYLGLGSNLGAAIDNLKQAIQLINADESTFVTAVSGLYSTRPVGFVDQPDFVNAVIEVETSLDPADLLRLCNSAEERLGRERTIRWGPRVIDVDILIYDGVEMDSESLTIPHPRMMERAFVLVPLADIAPELKLPGGLTASVAAGQIDQDGVERIDDESWS